MNRREFSKTIGVGIGGALLAPILRGTAADRSESSSEAKPVGTGVPSGPNVLFIAADDMRGASVGCLGDPVAKTPNIDRIGARGIVFDRAYCQQAICNPSRASLMTGKRPDTLRVWNLGTHFRETMPDVITLPQWFKQHGYFTQSVGKIYHAGQTRIAGDPASWSVPQVLHWANHNQDDVARVPLGIAPSAPTLEPTDDIRDVPDEAYKDGRVAAAAIDALRAIAARNSPFFLGVGFWKPHTPFNPPKRYWDLYRPEDIPPPRPALPPESAPALALESQYLNYASLVKSTPAAAAELRRGYYASISYMDAQVGKVLDELDRLGLADNTIIVFWGDHGYQQGEHGMWGKTSCFELDTRVPLIIAPPRRLGLPLGTHAPALVELLDVYPTLVELAGLPMIGGLEGTSLVPLIKDPSATVQLAAFSQHPRPWTMWPPDYYGTEADAMGYSVRTPSWRYTEWRGWNTGEVIARELYDERADPDATRNCASNPAFAGALRECAALVSRQFGATSPREIAALR